MECPTPIANSNEPLPAYTFVPGGPWPHPIRSPQGHSFGRSALAVHPSDRDRGARSVAFLRGAELFNAGYYWEAHEAWEALWHAYGRSGPSADVLKAMIKLAASGVKVREGQEHGVRIHADRAAALLRSVRQEVGRHHLGLDLDELAERARLVAVNPPRDPGPPGAAVSLVFAFRIDVDLSREEPASPR
jgi:hypothetical protein